MKILVADDDRVFQILLRKVLVLWGYEPIAVEDGEQAWQFINSPNGPQLAILDWLMPRADGLEVCRRVRDAKLAHYVYVVLLTSKTDNSDLVAGLEAGADDYLPKPVNLNQLKLRLRAATRVLEAEKRHRLIAEIASDGIMSIGSDRTIRFANTAASGIFGFPVEELVGKSFSAVIPAFDVHLARADTATAPVHPAAQVRSWAPVELSGRHRLGQTLLLEVSFAESVDGPDQSIITAMIRDVTERKVRDSQQAHAQKLESIGQLAAGVAHEINTPIQYIGDNLRFIDGSFRNIERVLRAYQQAHRDLVPGAPSASSLSELEELAATLDLDYLIQESPQAIEQALEGVGRVAEIVRAMKEFSHPGNLETAPVDLNHLLDNTALVSRNRWKYVAELKTDLDPELPRVRCLAGELSQVFLNLIVNAGDAIAAAAKDHPGKKGELSIATRRDGRFAEVRIQDNGTGIADEVRGKVFDPFFTTKAVGSGTGQGLSIAYTIVAKKHRGTIDFETEVNVGTTFIIRLPIDGPDSYAMSEQNGSGTSMVREVDHAI